MRLSHMTFNLSTLTLLTCLCTGATGIAEDAESEAMWKSLSGHWVRYSGDRIMHKEIENGQEIFSATSQYSEPQFKTVNPLVLTQEAGIQFYTKLDPQTQKPVYKGAFKIYDDRFYELGNGMLASNDKEPKLYEYVRIDSPIFQLHQAARDGDTKTIQELLDAGIEADATLWSSYTAMAYAGAGGHLDAIDLLIKHGADINKKARFGKTPLNHAVGGGSRAACELLIKHGAALDARNWNGGTLLHEAAFWGQPELIPFFVDKGVEVDNPGKGGSTPLVYATNRARWMKEDEKRAPFLECIRTLLHHGANPDTKNKDGQSARSIATGTDLEALHELLK